uniref:Integrase catalytic domain-containing protein n=1 Tax=Nicotiana tabacum TaxID=4097 RepID=A0A1S3XBU8_TOBAC|nr:PREDICTED: uncharacterized protein LOC107763413 [Nicotiana tabacum]
MAYPGLLQPLPIPNQAWSHISMDFIEGLPRSKNKEVILVVVDRLTKYAHFITLAHPYTAVSVAEVFWKKIHRLHGISESVVIDRDNVFLSHFWQALFKLLGTQLHYSTAYHPQSDGQTEMVNRQRILALRRNLKLSSKYYGPYKVLARIGKVAYKLYLPPESKVHSVFHVSLLKKKVGDRVVVETTLLITSEDGKFLVKPVAILQRRLIKRNNFAVVRVLVQWSNFPPEDATWEDYHYIKARFPEFDSNT